MRKRVFAVIFAAIWLLGMFTACSDAEKNTAENTPSLTPAPTPGSRLVSTPAPTPDPAPDPGNVPTEASVYEYGEMNFIVDYNESLLCYLLYPQAISADADRTISEWANGVYKRTQEEIAALSASDAQASGEINIQYNSYLVNNSFVGVEEIGFYSHSYMAHPEEFFQTFNIDLNSGRILAKDEILDAAKQIEVLRLLRERILAQYPDLALTEAEMDDSWLDNVVLNHDGIEVLLARGEHLPTYIGSQRFELEYSHLGDAYLLSNKRIEPSSVTPGTSQEPETTPKRYAVDPDKPMIALTFDDGPSKVTPRILEMLGKYGGRATFCVVGNRVKNYTDTMNEIVAQGSEIIGHSWDHKQLTKLSSDKIKQELNSVNDAIEQTIGVRPALYRPPYGAVNEKVKTASKELGLSVINWSIDTLDWKYKNANSIYKTVMKQIGDGKIILCHDLYTTTGDAMERVIPELIEQGYQLVTVSELLESKGAEIKPGKVYFGR